MGLPRGLSSSRAGALPDPLQAHSVFSLLGLKAVLSTQVFLFSLSRQKDNSSQTKCQAAASSPAHSNGSKAEEPSHCSGLLHPTRAFARAKLSPFHLWLNHSSRRHKVLLQGEGNSSCACWAGGSMSTSSRHLQAVALHTALSRSSK